MVVPAFGLSWVMPNDTGTGWSRRMISEGLMVTVSCVDCPTVRAAGAAVSALTVWVAASAGVGPPSAVATAVHRKMTGMEMRRLVRMTSAQL